MLVKWLVAFMLLFPAFASAGGVTLPAEVQTYGQAVREWMAGQREHSKLSDIYQQGRTLAQQLAPKLESLSEVDYAHLAETMRGFWVFREEVVGIEPKFDFFYALAKKSGTPEDVAFFGLMVQIYGQGTWPAYLEQQTDYSGCSRFGDGTLTTLFLAAQPLRRTMHGIYRTELDDLIRAMQAQLTSPTCVCGDANTVLKELTLFTKKMPRARFMDQVQQRISTIKAGKSQDRFMCQSG